MDCNITIDEQTYREFKKHIYYNIVTNILYYLSLVIFIIYQPLEALRATNSLFFGILIAIPIYLGHQIVNFKGGLPMYGLWFLLREVLILLSLHVNLWIVNRLWFR